MGFHNDDLPEKADSKSRKPLEETKQYHDTDEVFYGENEDDDASHLNIQNLNGRGGNIAYFNSWLLNAGKKNWEYEKKIIKEILGTDDWARAEADLNLTTLRKFSTEMKYHDIFIYDKKITNTHDQPFSGKLDGIPYFWTQIFYAKSVYADHIMICPVKDVKRFEAKINEINKKEDIDLPYDKIILAEGIKEKFYKSTFGFIENVDLREKFKKHFMKFKRCLLLYGAPGCGKTCLVTWLRARAQEKNWKIFNWENMSGDSYIYRDKMKNTLFILEDIDQIMAQRDGTIYNSKGPGFSQILNLLDGFDAMDNYIVVMTTNFPNILDKALLRDGRTDERIHIDYPTKELKLQYIDALIKPILPDLDISKLNKFINDDKVPFAALDNLRKKIFIYESLDKTLETFKKEETENKNKVGFEKVTTMKKYK